MVLKLDTGVEEVQRTVGGPRRLDRQDERPERLDKHHESFKWDPFPSDSGIFASV